VGLSLVKQGIQGAGVWYRVETYTNQGPDTQCVLSFGWGHIENKCSSKHKWGICAGHHRTSDNKCNVVGCTAKQGSLRGHTGEVPQLQRILYRVQRQVREEGRHQSGEAEAKNKASRRSVHECSSGHANRPELTGAWPLAPGGGGRRRR
jgi:hypothetical protein